MRRCQVDSIAGTLVAPEERAILMDRTKRAREEDSA